MKVIFLVFTDGPVVPGAGGVFGGPMPGFTAPTESGEHDKHKLVQTHLRVFQEQVEAAQEFNPVLVNSHSLKDYFTVGMARDFFQAALPWQQRNGFNVAHETHRKRFLHSPWVARDFIPEFPEIQLVLDASHFITIAETNTQDLDLTKVIEDLAPQVVHVHCRVGYDHGPQVSDPRAPEWLPYMEGHERWWDAVWRAQAKHGMKVSTMTPEHGPPSYQQTLPHSREPVANIWDVNHWIALRRQKRFEDLFGTQPASVRRVVPSESQDEMPDTHPGESILKGLDTVGFK